MIRNSNIKKIRFGSTVLAVFFALPLGWQGFTGLYIWLSPFLMLNSFLFLKSIVWLNIFSITILFLLLIYNRFFCRFLCPVGWACDLVLAYSINKKFSLKSFPTLGVWLAIVSFVSALFGLTWFSLLDPLVIFNAFFIVFSKELSLLVGVSFLGLPVLIFIHWVFPGLWCSKLCPLGGMQDIVKKIKYLFVSDQANYNHRKQQNILFARRTFLATSIGATAGILLPKFLMPNTKQYLRPPGAVNANLFGILCVRCGNCIKSCPTKIISNCADPGAMVSWMAPKISFKDSYCLETCTLCGNVCPSGAISMFNVEDKKNLKIGLVEIDQSRCYLTNNTECDRCKSVCPYDAIEIKTEGSTIEALPVIDDTKCVGCGACVIICPPGVIKIEAGLNNGSKQRDIKFHKAV